MKPERIAYIFLGSFLTTIFCLRWWQESEYPLVLWLTFLSAFLNLIIFKHTRQIIIPVTLGVLIALLNVQRTTHTPSTETIDNYADGSKVIIRGKIVDEPDRRPLQTKYTIEVKSLTNLSGTTIPVRGKVLATDRKQWPEFNYGDEVEVKGRLEHPGVIERFSYKNYLSRFEIFSVVYWAELEKISEENATKSSLSSFSPKKLSKVRSIGFMRNRMRHS